MKNLLIVITAFSFIGCNNQLKQKGNNEPIKEIQDIFPVTSFLAGQIHEVDSLQLPVLKYITTNNKTDSALISSREFKALAKEFMEPDITDPSIKKYYKETSFADQSIPSVTLTYSTPE